MADARRYVERALAEHRDHAQIIGALGKGGSGEHQIMQRSRRAVFHVRTNARFGRY
jgi:hypothetical protein